MPIRWNVPLKAKPKPGWVCIRQEKKAQCLKRHEAATNFPLDAKAPRGDQLDSNGTLPHEKEMKWIGWQIP